MSKRKLKIKLSPDEAADLRAVLDATKGAADEVVQQIVIDFVAKVREQRRAEEASPSDDESPPNPLALEKLESDSRKATKERLEAKHQVEGVAEGLQQVLERQQIDLTPTSVAAALAERRKGESVGAGLKKLTTPLTKVIDAGGKIVLSIGSMVTEPAGDGDRP